MEHPSLLSTKKRLKRKNFLTQSKALLHVSTLLSNAYTLRRVADIIINEGFAVLNAHSGDISLLKENNELEVIGAKGYAADFVDLWPTIPPDTPLLTTEVINSKKPYFVHHVDQLDNKYQVAKSFIATSNALAAALLPLKIKNKIIGIMEFTFTEPQDFSSEEKIFMATLANQCAQAVERVLAIDKLKDSNKQLEIILRNTADGIIVCDHNGLITYSNKVAAQLCEFETAAALKGHTLDTIFTHYETRDITKKLATQANIQTQSSAKESEKILELHTKHSEGTRWLHIKSTTIKDQHGKVKMTIHTLHDMTLVHELEERKDDFISIASHELKTPLTTLSLFTEMLAKKSLNDPEEKNFYYIEKIKTQLSRLSKLITDLLDVSQIQKGKMQFKDELFSLDKLIYATVEELQIANPDFQLELQSTTPIKIKADKLRMYQVISNLISNAMKYTTENKHIVLTLTQENNNAKVSVKDFGIGISQEHLNKIFNRFYQIKERRESSYSGLGMGLFISNEIVRHYGGNIDVISKKGSGSTFSFTIPIYDKN